MWWVVDRIEGRIAVLVSDAGEQAELPRGRLREGQVYWWDGRRLRRSRAEEKRRRQEAADAYARMPRGPSGNFEL